MILRTTYDGTGGGVAEDRRFYYAQNWRADVSVVLDDAGVQQERVIYSPYGQPFAMPAGDTNFDGDFEAGVDGDELADWDINGVPYRAYADVNLDGDIDGADATAASEHDLGWNVLTSGGGGASGVNNRLGYAGYIHDRDVATAAHVRYRVYKIDLGRSLCVRPSLAGGPAPDSPTYPSQPEVDPIPPLPTFLVPQSPETEGKLCAQQKIRNCYDCCAQWFPPSVPAGAPESDHSDCLWACVDERDRIREEEKEEPDPGEPIIEGEAPRRPDAGWDQKLTRRCFTVAEFEVLGKKCKLEACVTISPTSEGLFDEHWYWGLSCTIEVGD